MILCEPLKQSAFDLHVKYFVISGLLKLVYVAGNFRKTWPVCGQLKIQYI